MMNQATNGLSVDDRDERFRVRFSVRNGERQMVEEVGPFWLQESEVFFRIRQIQMSLPPAWTVMAEGHGPRSRWRCWRSALPGRVGRTGRA